MINLSYSEGKFLLDVLNFVVERMEYFEEVEEDILSARDLLESHIEREEHCA
jgi:hypothetical protein